MKTTLILIIIFAINGRIYIRIVNGTLIVNNNKISLNSSVENVLCHNV